MNIVESHFSDLQKLCTKYHVEKMYLFGSAITSNFNEKSDIDFLVKFKPIDLPHYFENYMELKDNLTSLLGREVDLIEEQALINPILINSINRSKELVYG